MSKIEVDEVVNQTGDNDSGIDLSTNDVVKVNIAGSEAVRVNSLGQIGVGITSLDNTYSQSRAIQLASVSDNNWGGTVMLTSADGSSVFSRLVASTDGLDLINTKNTNIRFFTNNTELMRLTSSGLAIGDSMQPTRHGATTECLIFNSSTTTGHAALHCGRIGTGTETQIIFSNAAGQRGNITTNHSAVQYNTSSDYRLKENVVTDWDATSRLKQLKPSRFNFKVDKDTTVDGFLAHEVSSIVPEATTGTKDEVETYTDEDGKEQTRPVYQGIDQSKLVPLLTKALQEAVAKIEALETKNDALEARLTALEVK